MTELIDHSKIQEQQSQAKPVTVSSHPSSRTPSIAPLSIQYFKLQQFQPNGCIDKLSFMLIRPPKLTYDDRLLVPPIRDSRFKYTVQKIPFPLSIYTPNTTHVDYHILYLHGNSSSRLQGSAMLRFLPPNVGLACFDFDGCGNREGQWITLGLKQSKEVDIAAEFLISKGYNIALWGRSMGAVSALMSTKVKIIVADSAFSNLQKVSYETASRNAKSIPNCLISCMFPCVYSLIRKDIVKKTGCDICQLDVLERIKNMPDDNWIMFISGENDQMINPNHSKLLYNQFKGNKGCLWFKGTHNSTRSPQVLAKCFDFIEKGFGSKFITNRTIQPSQLRFTEKYNSQTINCTSAPH